MKRNIATWASVGLVTGMVAVSMPAAALVVTNGGYTATDGIAFQWQELSTPSKTAIAGATRVLGNNDDSATPAIDLGFNFSLFNITYNQIHITSNGLLTFGSTNTVNANTDLGLSMSWSTMPFIAPAWNDWTTTYSGTDGVYYATLGAAGARSFVVEWHDTKAYDQASNSNSSPVSFEAVLYEGSNNIELRYLDMNTGGSSVNPDASFGKTSTVGIRDVDAYLNGRFLQWSNNADVLADGTAILISTVPEPGTIALTLAGLGLIATVRRRKQKAV